MTKPETQPTKPRPPKRKGEGQWKLGYREPLNPNEQVKKDDNPLNVRARIENIYAVRGFDSIDKQDLRGRMRWWGLYTQREQGYDGTWTGDENIDVLEAKYFMLRVRCDGGALSTAALRTLGEISTEFARDTADISDRENVQYHWIQIEDMPEIWKRLAEVGLQTTEACGDCPRVVLGSPLAGDSLDEVLDATPAIDEIVRRYIGKPEYSNLPRKFKTAISGLQDVCHEVNDVAFIGVNHPEHGPGLDLWVGGGLVHQPDAGPAGRRLGAAGRGARRVGGRRVGVPRLRLPPAALQGAAEVPDQGLGRREIPPGARGRIPRTQADRRPRARTGASTRSTTSACRSSRTG